MRPPSRLTRHTALATFEDNLASDDPLTVAYRVVDGPQVETGKIIGRIGFNTPAAAFLPRAGETVEERRRREWQCRWTLETIVRSAVLETLDWHADIGEPLTLTPEQCRALSGIAAVVVS